MNNRNQKKMDQWMTCAGIGILACVITFFIMMNMDDGATSTRVFVILFFLLMVFTIFSVVKTNIYNAKVKNMNAEEYLNDRFENGWKETKELFGTKNNDSAISVRCPYCNSYNTNKISTMSKAIGAALIGVHALARNSKQWHCNDCGSDF